MNEKDRKFLIECPYLARAKVYALEHAGVKFIDSRNVYIGENAQVGAGTIIWPNVYLLGDTKIGENCEIGPDVTLEDTAVGVNARIKRGCEITRSQIGSNCVCNPFCYTSDSCVGDNCTIWVNVSMFHAELKEYVVVHRDTRLVWSKIGPRSNLEASCQIKYASIGSDCRVCHSIIEGEKFSEEALARGKRSACIARSCAIGPWAYLYGSVTINPEARIAEADVTNSFIGKRVRAYRCRISDSKVLHNAIVEEGAWIHDNSKIGPHCEVSRAEIVRSALGARTEAKHCSYIGDVKMGCGCNVGAGTVFGNYDGREKYQCEVGDNAFIGINTSIVNKSTGRIGEESFIGAHMLVRRPVEDNVAIAPEPFLVRPFKWSSKKEDGWELIQLLPSKRPESRKNKQPSAS